MYLKIFLLLVLAGCGDHVDRPSATNRNGSFAIGNGSSNRFSDFSTETVPSPSIEQHDDHYEGPNLDRDYDDQHEHEHEHEHEDREHEDDE